VSTKTVSDKALAVNAWESLFRAQVTIMRELTACFPSGEISFNEYDVLFNLSTQPERRARIKELTQHLLLTQPSISRLVDRLASKGIVEKLSDPGDGRGIIVVMTDLGGDLFRATAVRHANAISKRVGAALDRAELEKLLELCTKLRLGTPIADLPDDDRAWPTSSDAATGTEAGAHEADLAQEKSPALADAPVSAGAQ
jgi:DNA-binding MarR family transcriptional regulator